MSAPTPTPPRISTRSPRRILLVDADAFFVAVARKVDPEGAGRARLLIVGGNPGSRGVVCSASYECRAYGVRSAMPVSRAIKLCPDALCVPVPRRACTEASREIQAILSRFSPIVQASSIDEWFCDLGGTEALYAGETLVQTAARIRKAVHEATGITVSVGGGSSRLVAKMAVELAKPRPENHATGVHCVTPGEEATFMRRFRLAELPMVGPRFAARLERMGLFHVEEAQRWPESLLVQHLGERAGRWLAQRVHGQDDTPVLPRDRQIQISREITFAHDLENDSVIERELQRLSVRVSADMRNQLLLARTVTVKLRDADFRTRTAQRTFSRGIESERSVTRAANTLFRQLRTARRVPVRLLGVGLSHLDGRDAAPGPAVAQLGLFGDPVAAPGGEHDRGSGAEPIGDTDRDRALVRALDRIRGRFGHEAILPASLVHGNRNPGEDTGPRVEE